ncbi:MAG: hypothetical protein C0596_02320 [Marinilabiliales bacterium]|nr:MAG: hypothetical protein C0596_02320 [Marinilabiliales bacterium]
MKTIIPILILVFAFETTSYSQCSNPDAGEDFAICGSTTTISVENATTGYWTAMYTDNPCAINIHPDITATETNITISGFPSSHMIINVVLHDDSGPCTDTVQIEFVEIPEAHAGDDQEVCGTCFYSEAVSSGGYGYWDTGSMCWVDFPDEFLTYFCCPSYGDHEFIWIEENESMISPLICSSSDTVIITTYRMPTANIITETNTTVYGLTFENLIAEYPGNGIIGYWVIDHPAAYFGDDFSYETSVTVPYYGSYEIYWHEENGPFSLSAECSDDSNPIVMHFVDPIYSDIKTHEKDDIVIFPNPASNYILINSDEDITDIAIYDINGRLVKECNIKNNAVYVSELENGMYFIEFRTNDMHKFCTFVKD